MIKKGLKKCSYMCISVFRRNRCPLYLIILATSIKKTPDLRNFWDTGYAIHIYNLEPSDTLKYIFLEEDLFPHPEPKLFLDSLVWCNVCVTKALCGGG